MLLLVFLGIDTSIFYCINEVAISSGSLITKDLADIVKAEDFVLNSEYLQTLMVVVPKYVLLVSSV